MMTRQAQDYGWSNRVAPAGGGTLHAHWPLAGAAHLHFILFIDFPIFHYFFLSPFIWFGSVVVSTYPWFISDLR